MVNIVKKVRNIIACSKISEFQRKAAFSFELHIRIDDEAEAADRAKEKYWRVVIEP